MSEQLSIRRKVAVVTALTLGLAACGTGRGGEITECKNDASPVEATFVGEDNYDASTDPAELANFNVSLTQDEDRSTKPVQDSDNSGLNLTGWDVLDSVGEISCSADDTVLLTVDGARLSNLYQAANGDNS